MNKIKASYEILTPIDGIKELQHIEKIGRVCYKSEGAITEDGESAKRFVKMLIKNGHEAMIEHSSLSVKFTVDRGVSHELVRHRIASFAQESTRYVNYSLEKFGNEINVIDIEDGIKLDRGMMTNLSAEAIEKIVSEWEAAMWDAEKHYLNMIELGATPQMARSVLANSTKTEITITANYREWRNFFRLRRDEKTVHPQMLEVVIPLLDDLKQKLPVIFEDLYAEDEEKFYLINFIADANDMNYVGANFILTEECAKEIKFVEFGQTDDDEKYVEDYTIENMKIITKEEKETLLRLGFKDRHFGCVVFLAADGEVLY